MEGRTFRARIEALRASPDPPELVSLEQDMVNYFNRVVDAAESARGENRTPLLALGQRLDGAIEGFEQAREALGAGNTAGYLEALDVLAACCPS